MSPEPSSRGEQTRTAILQAAHDLFVEQGYHGTSMRQIASRAGIALGGLYNHFPSKEAVFEAVFFAYHPYHEVLPYIQQAQGATVEEVIHDAASRMVEAVRGRPDFLNLMFIEMVELKSVHAQKLINTFYPGRAGDRRAPDANRTRAAAPHPAADAGALLPGALLRLFPHRDHLCHRRPARVPPGCHAALRGYLPARDFDTPSRVQPGNKRNRSMFNSRLRSLIRKEFIQITRDARTLILVMVIPVMQLFLLGYAATNDVRNIPLAVFDQDRGSAARCPAGCLPRRRLLPHRLRCRLGG